MDQIRPHTLDICAPMQELGQAEIDRLLDEGPECLYDVCPVCAKQLIESKEAELKGPPPGSWADVARMMASCDDSGFDWDSWKDEMKEQEIR